MELTTLSFVPASPAKQAFAAGKPPEGSFTAAATATEKLAPPGLPPPPNPAGQALGEEGAISEPNAPTQIPDFFLETHGDASVFADVLSSNEDGFASHPTAGGAKGSDPSTEAFAALSAMGPILVATFDLTNLDLSAVEPSAAIPGQSPHPAVSPTVETDLARIQGEDRMLAKDGESSHDSASLFSLASASMKPEKLKSDPKPMVGPDRSGSEPKPAEPIGKPEKLKSDPKPTVGPDRSGSEPKPAEPIGKPEKLKSDPKPEVSQKGAEPKLPPAPDPIPIEEIQIATDKPADKKPQDHLSPKPAETIGKPEKLKSDPKPMPDFSSDAGRNNGGSSGPLPKAAGHVEARLESKAWNAMPESEGSLPPVDPRPNAADPSMVVRLDAKPRVEPQAIHAERLVMNTAESHRLVDQVADRMEALAASHSRRSVTIRLEPEDFGAVTLVVKQSRGEVDAEVYASHNSVRQALEQNRPLLTTALEHRGIQLGSMTVGHELSQGSGRQEEAMREAAKAHQPTYSSRQELPAMTLDAIRNLARQATGIDLWI